ncbi:leucine-rich repeat domain-containing protein [Paenibacillus ginsengarvi]|uniref:Leucine-rich repeat domain-containing protein n=1 Tax=Paenibacillus ginsengarvi TaxID=400777 RepID=A0A3B0BXT7_9BACL|nr:leucine-rich repeat domain-containing protein [Paenibacillus ginsengarvi]RKN78273.1 leucine-rich repeat domain-containing protein [Paenibacillus ginsengarvi]
MDITMDFIDERFRFFILETFCGGRDTIRSADVEGIETLLLSRKEISSFRGLEHFTSLKQLDCSYNKLKELDIGRLTRLVALECAGNQLTALNTSGNPHLAQLNCNSNEIIALDLTVNSMLETLDCGFNRIKTLDISKNERLEQLICYWNMISKLELEQNRHLRKLSCGYNALFALELNNHKELEYLDCGSNYLINLDLSSCENLLELRCNNNHLSRLDVSGNRALQSLRCFNNHITSLPFDHPHLEEIYCSENKISVLDTNLLPKLKRLDYTNNLIREPDHTVHGVGTFLYDMSMSDYKAALLYMGKELAVTAGVVTKEAMERLSPLVKMAWERMEELQEQALQNIAEQHPEEDVSELVYSELLFEEDGTIRLGFDAGDTPAGRLYIYAVYDRELEMDEALVYETY